MYTIKKTLAMRRKEKDSNKRTVRAFVLPSEYVRARRAKKTDTRVTEKKLSKKPLKNFSKIRH